MTLLGLAVVSRPYVISAYYLEQAGRALDGEPPDIQQAVLQAKQALRFTPNEAHAYRLLAQAHLNENNGEAAIEALTTYTQLRPDDPGGQFDLGTAYYRAGQTEKAVALWQAMGLTGEGMLQYANNALQQANYQAALLWAEQAALMDANPAQVAYVQGTIYARRGNETSAKQAFELVRQLDASLLPSLTVTDYMQFDNQQFNGLDQRLITTRSLEDGETLIIVFANRTISQSFFLSDSGKFKFTLQAQNRLPPPIEIRIKFNDAPPVIMTFDKADNSWENKNIDIELPVGVNMIEISFINDATVNGLDRNLFIKKVKIERVLE